MKATICEKFGIDFPLFAFSHCRDVVAAIAPAAVAEPPTAGARSSNTPAAAEF
jgi:hypothetical protein